jgi:uncharacterized membrane protein
MSEIVDLLKYYFITPYHADSGYNLVNTTVYAVIALLALYIVYQILKYYKIKIDLKFFIAVLPFILIGSTIRALVDSDILPYTTYTVSPGIYLTVAILFFTSFAVAYNLPKKFKKVKYPPTSTTAVIGLLTYFLILLITFNKIHLTNAFGFFIITTVFLTTSAVTYLALKTLKWKWGTQKTAFLAIASHLLDASTTFIIVDFFGGWEKHPLPRFLADSIGTAATQFPLKLLVLLPITYLINTELKDKNLKNFLLIAIATLGLAEGLRNLISLIII